MSCKHQKQKLEPSKAAKEVGYSQLGRTDNAKAAGFVVGDEPIFEDADYPGPLVLPNDDIDFNPKYPAQDFQEWRELVDSHKCPPERRKIYVAGPPRHEQSLHLTPSLDTSEKALPQASHVLEYLVAFYSGFEVVELPKNTLIFDKWIEGRKKVPSRSYVALNTPKESIRIRKRPRPNGASGMQLNLNDLLDVAIAVLPEDALALILLVEQDMYEDEDDDFACGRAFGGSHVCVVSSFRYNPIFDIEAKIDRAHTWPASHCAKFVSSYEDLFIEKPVRKRKRSPSSRVAARQPSVPLGKAIEAHKLLDWNDATTTSSQWLSRVCRTASHELGHCLGIDHCMYYACIMQGTASISEDLRQPPYLCPVDEAKVSNIIAERGDPEKGSTRSREEALLNFAKKHSRGGGFAAYQAWLEERLTRTE